MINVTAADVKKLRQMTNAGFMDCKAVLVAAKGDFELAKELLRKKGLQLADKKADRETNCGLVGVKVIHHEEDDAYNIEMREVLCETDFVCRNDVFQRFVEETLDTAPKNIDTSDIIAKVGENVKVNASPSMLLLLNPDECPLVVGSYVHNKVTDSLGTSVSAIALETKPGLTEDEVKEVEALAHTLAMHIVAMKPLAIDTDELDGEWLENERRIFTEQALESGKPENIVEKMVEGKLQKRMREVCLVNQPLVTDQDMTVAQKISQTPNVVGIQGIMRLTLGE